MNKNNEKQSSDNKKSNDIIFRGKLPTIDQLNKLLISEALKRADGNHSTAAGMLGISPQYIKKFIL